MSRARWLLAGLSMRGALSWPTFVVAYLINLSVAAVGGFGASASWPQRLVAVTVATGAMFAVVLALRPAEIRMHAGPSRGLLALAAFAVAGAVRGMVVASFFVAWGVDGGTGELPRIVGGIALGLAVLAPMSLLVGQAREFAIARARLLAQRQQLIAAVEHVATQIEDRDVRVVERVRVALMNEGWPSPENHDHEAFRGRVARRVAGVRTPVRSNVCLGATLHSPTGAGSHCRTPVLRSLHLQRPRRRAPGGETRRGHGRQAAHPQPHGSRQQRPREGP